MNTTEQNAAKNTEAQVRRVLDVMNQGKLKQAIRITATPSQQPLPKTASKFGGVPYLPVGESAPTNAFGQPLGMIAQINCAQLPQNNIYPKSGMLQFWIDPHDTVWGMTITSLRFKRTGGCSTTRAWVSRTRMRRCR